MNTFIDRLQHFMTLKGINDNQLTVSAELSTGLIGKAKSGKKGMASGSIEKILLAYPELSPDWLLTGRGEMLNTKSQDDAANSNDIDGVPLLPIEAMAGFFTGEVSVNERDCERLNIPGLKADFVVPVSGDSMEPKYFSGDMVACQMVYLSDLFFQWGKVYVIDTNQGVLLKKVKKGSSPDCITLVSENPEYDNIELPRSDIHHIALVKGLVRLI